MPPRKKLENIRKEQRNGGWPAFSENLSKMITIYSPFL
jgi:hypothetical protein